MDPETEKQLKDLGSQLVSLREELKPLKDSPKTDPKEIASLKTEISTLSKAWEETLAALRPPEPPKPLLKPTKARGFGFFRFLTGSDE